MSITVLFALTGIAIAWLGIEMANRPPKTHRARRGYRISFLGLGLVVFVLTILQYRQNTAKEYKAESEAQTRSAKLEKEISAIRQDNAALKETIAKKDEEIAKISKQQLATNQQQLALNYIPSAAFVYRDKRIEIYNNGKTNLYLWGITYGDMPVVVDKEPREIVPGTSYHVFADDLEKQLLISVRNEFITCHAFITTQDSKKHTIKFVLLGKVDHGALTVHTQTIGATDGWVVK